jgi:WD40 repeat protein
MADPVTHDNRPVITRHNVHQLVEVMRTRRAWITEVAWSPNGQALAVSSAEGVSLHDAATLKKLGALQGHGGPVKGIAVNHDGTLIASASADTTLRLWNLKAGGQPVMLKGHTDSVDAVALSLNGLVASGGADKTVRLWDAVSGQERRVMTGHSGEVATVAFCWGGRVLASGGWDHSIRLWDVETGEWRTTLWHQDWVRHLQPAPDDRLLASASKDGTIKLWEVETGAERLSISAHGGGADGVAFSPDGALLATAGRDHAIKFWDAASGEPLFALRAHDKPVLTLAFSPDGTRLATGSGDNTVRLWSITP